MRSYFENWFTYFENETIYFENGTCVFENENSLLIQAGYEKLINKRICFIDSCCFEASQSNPAKQLSNYSLNFGRMNGTNRRKLSFNEELIEWNNRVFLKKEAIM